MSILGIVYSLFFAAGLAAGFAATLAAGLASAFGSGLGFGFGGAVYFTPLVRMSMAAAHLISQSSTLVVVMISLICLVAPWGPRDLGFVVGLPGTLCTDAFKTTLEIT